VNKRSGHPEIGSSGHRGLGAMHQPHHGDTEARRRPFSEISKGSERCLLPEACRLTLLRSNGDGDPSPATRDSGFQERFSPCLRGEGSAADRGALKASIHFLAAQTKLASSFVSPVPLYFAT